MDGKNNAFGRAPLSGSPPPRGSQTVPDPTGRSLSIPPFHEMAGSQTDPALFSAAQLREIDRRQELVVKKFFGCFQILEDAHGSFRNSINQMDVELNLLRETVGSLSASSEERFQSSDAKLEACSKLCSEIITDVGNLGNSHLDSCFQEMINKMNSLFRNVEARLQDMENNIVAPTAGELGSNITSKEELLARHQTMINNSREVSNAFEQRHQEIERRIIKSEDKFTTLSESFTTMNELLSMEIATREQDFVKQCEGKGALQTKGSLLRAEVKSVVPRSSNP